MRKLKTKPSFAVLANNIRSLYNVGSIFRTAEAFGVSKLYLTGYTGNPENLIHRSKISKVALGAENFLSWEYHKSAQKVIRLLKKEKYKIVALENNIPKAYNLFKFKPKFPLLLVLGEEVGGINKNLLKQCEVVLEIPMLGKKDSLNVSVAFGVAISHITPF